MRKVLLCLALWLLTAVTVCSAEGGSLTADYLVDEWFMMDLTQTGRGVMTRTPEGFTLTGMPFEVVIDDEAGTLSLVPEGYDPVFIGELYDDRMDFSIFLMAEGKLDNDAPTVLFLERTESETSAPQWNAYLQVADRLLFTPACILTGGNRFEYCTTSEKIFIYDADNAYDKLSVTLLSEDVFLAENKAHAQRMLFIRTKD